MTFDVAVNGTRIGAITVTGGRVVLKEWPGILGATFEVALPELVAASWPSTGSVRTPRPFSVGLLLHASTVPGFHSLFDAVAAVVQTTGTVTLTRYRELLTGQQVVTARGVYLGGMDPSPESASAGRAMPKWQLLEEWHA